MKRGRPTEKQEAQIVAWVNRRREKEGLQPLKRLPKGAIGCRSQCPIAVAFNEEAFVDEARSEVFDQGVVKHPLYIKSFILRFDAGEYPELIA